MDFNGAPTSSTSLMSEDIGGFKPGGGFFLYSPNSHDLIKDGTFTTVKNQVVAVLPPAVALCL